MSPSGDQQIPHAFNQPKWSERVSECEQDGDGRVGYPLNGIDSTSTVELARI